MRLRRSRLTHRQSERLLEHFVAGTPARPAAGLVGVNRNTATRFYHRLREIIERRLAQENPFANEVVIDNSGFDAAGKVPVFGLVKRGSRIHAVLLLGGQRQAFPAPKSRARPDAIVYTTGTPEVPDTIDVSACRHERVRDHRRLARGRRPIDSIENFWSQAKRQLGRYNGLPRRHLHLFLKECEWRYHYGPPATLLKVLKSWIKSGRD